MPDARQLIKEGNKMKNEEKKRLSVKGNRNDEQHYQRLVKLLKTQMIL